MSAPRFVVSVSGGNDSVAMVQWAYEAGIGGAVVVYCDTGWAAPGWAGRVDLVEAFARALGFEFVRLSGMGFEDLARMKSGFPVHGSQWCTSWLKGLPFLQWIDEVDQERLAVVMIGKRRCESVDRRGTPEFVEDSEFHGGRRVWHPLFCHSDGDRDGLLGRAGFDVLPHRSDECSPCVNANRDDLRRLCESDILKVEELELEVGQPVFRAGKHGGAVGIRQVVMWSKYSPGQYAKAAGDLFSDAGCGSPFGCGL